MHLNGTGNVRSARSLTVLAALCALAFVALATYAVAQENTSTSQSSEARPATPAEITQTIFLENAVDQHDLNDIATALRNVMPRAKIFPVQGQNAITLRVTEGDLATAQKLIAELDKPHQVYRLTYTITTYEGGKRTGSEKYVLLAAAGTRTIFKQGSKVPIVTGMRDKETAEQSTQVQYQDIGLYIDATVSVSPENPMLHSKVEQSSLAGEKSATTPADPVVRQAVVEGFADVSQNKPAIIGSFDVPGTTRHQEIEVLAELVR
jgi:type II secretory pathway component GspD/PulD (secretin)